MLLVFSAASDLGLHNFHESIMSKKLQTVKSSQTDNVSAPFKCDIMVVKRL